VQKSIDKLKAKWLKRPLDCRLYNGLNRIRVKVRVRIRVIRFQSGLEFCPQLQSSKSTFYRWPAKKAFKGKGWLKAVVMTPWGTGARAPTFTNGWARGAP